MNNTQIVSAKKRNILPRVLKFSLFLGIGLTVLTVLYITLEKNYKAQCLLDGVPSAECNLLKKLYTDFLSVDATLMVMVLLAFTLSNLSRAMRWQMLLKPLGYRPKFLNLFLTIVLGYFANLALPRVGEFVRAGTLARYEGFSPEKTMATVVLDRLTDVISVLFIMALTFLLEFDKMWGFLSSGFSSKTQTLSSNILWICLVVGIVFLFLYQKFKYKIAQLPLYNRVQTMISGFVEGFSSIRRLESPFWFLFHSVAIWGLYYVMTYLCCLAFAPTAHLTPVAVLVVFVFGGLGVALPAPGGMGSYHALTIIALSLYGVNRFDGFSFANISFFSVQIICNVTLGLFSLLLLPYINQTNTTNVKEVARLEEH